MASHLRAQLNGFGVGFNNDIYTSKQLPNRFRRQQSDTELVHIARLQDVSDVCDDQHWSGCVFIVNTIFPPFITLYNVVIIGLFPKPEVVV